MEYQLIYINFFERFYIPMQRGKRRRTPNADVEKELDEIVNKVEENINQEFD